MDTQIEPAQPSDLRVLWYAVPWIAWAVWLLGGMQLISFVIPGSCSQFASTCVPNRQLWWLALLLYGVPLAASLAVALVRRGIVPWLVILAIAVASVVLLRAWAGAGQAVEQSGGVNRLSAGEALLALVMFLWPAVVAGLVLTILPVRPGPGSGLTFAVPAAVGSFFPVNMSEFNDALGVYPHGLHILTGISLGIAAGAAALAITMRKMRRANRGGEGI